LASSPKLILMQRNSAFFENRCEMTLGNATGLPEKHPLLRGRLAGGGAGQTAKAVRRDRICAPGWRESPLRICRPTPRAMALTARKRVTGSKSRRKGEQAEWRRA